VQPEVKDNMLPHFIRGLLDGDGSITKNSKRGDIKISLVNNKSVCSWVESNINRLLGISGCLYAHPSSDVAWNWEISSKEELGVFGEWVYKNSELYMDRKYDRYVSYGLIGGGG